MSVVVLDAEAMNALATSSSRRRTVVAALHAAHRTGRDVVVPAVILAELYRGPRHNAAVDSCLARESGIDVRDTDRGFARFAGGVLRSAGAGSADLADAHVVAVAAEAGGGVLVTGDAADLERLAATYAHVRIHAI